MAQNRIHKKKSYPKSNREGEIYDEEGNAPSGGGEKTKHAQETSAQAAGTEDDIDQLLAENEALAAQNQTALERADEALNEPTNQEADQVQNLYTPPQREHVYGRGSGRLRAGVAGGFIGGMFGVFSFFGVFQGPFQFINISQLLQRFHLSTPENFGDKLNGRYIAYALAGKSARGRLGIAANRRADRWERKLNRNGIRSVYSSGTQRGIGYQITDRAKAERFLSDMDRDGIPTNSRFPNGAVDVDGNPIDLDITGVNLELDTFRLRNTVCHTVCRSVLNEVKINNVRAALAARLFNRRSGTDGPWHPLRRRIREAADSYARYRQRIRDEENSRHRTGSVDTDVSQTRLGRLRARFRTAWRLARGPTAAIVLTCGAKAFSDSIDEQNLENQLVMARMGVKAVAVGDQTQALLDLNLEELAVEAEHFFDAQTQTSWYEDPGIQSELGNPATGTDYLEEYDLKPGVEKPELFQLLDSIPTGFEIGGVGVDACDIIQEGGEIVNNIPGISTIQSVMDGAVNLAISSTGRTLDEWRQWAIDRFATDVASTAARGALWGGIVNTGLRLSSNMIMALSGGRELSESEAGQVKEAAAEERRAEFAHAGIFERYFSVTNGESVAANLFMRVPANRSQWAGSLSRVASVPSALGSVFGNFTTDKATAQSTYDYGFPLIGFSTDEQDDERFENPYEVMEYYEDNPDELEEMNEEYGEDCFGMSISEDGDLEYAEMEEGDSLTETPDQCSEGVLGANTDDDGEVLAVQQENILRYRYHIAYTITGHTIDCFEDIDENSCDQLQGRANDEPAAPAGPGGGAGGPCPAPSRGNNPAPSDMVNVHGIMVHPCIAGSLNSMIAAAAQDGITLPPGGAYRSEQDQIQLRIDNGCPDIWDSPASSCRVPTAIPGSSRHNVGTAIDWNDMCFPNATCAGNARYDWLVANAARFGFHKLDSEAWHWSVDGS